MNSMLSTGVECSDMYMGFKLNADTSFMNAVNAEYKAHHGRLSLSECKWLVRGWSNCTDKEWNRENPNNPTWSF
jgi:hypothetical protein